MLDKVIDLLDEVGLKVNLLIDELNDEDVVECLIVIEVEKIKVLEEENYELVVKFCDEEIVLDKKLNSFFVYFDVIVEVEYI